MQSSSQQPLDRSQQKSKQNQPSHLEPREHIETVSQKTQVSENRHLSKLSQEIKDLTTEINSLLAEEQNEIHTNAQIKRLLILEAKFHNIKDLLVEETELTSNTKKSAVQESKSENSLPKQSDSSDCQKEGSQQQQQSKPTQQSKEESFESKVQLILKEAELYEPSMEEIEERKQALNDEMNDDGWTDATQSDAGEFDPNDIMVFDDEMLDEMGIGGEEEDRKEGEEQEEEQVDLEQLEDEFVTGGDSDEHSKYGRHAQKFCVSVRAIPGQNLLFSGGGDDFMNIYRLKGEQKDAESLPIKKVAHGETVTQIELSFDCQHVFSLTEKELLCTDVNSLESSKVHIDAPANLVCHQQGGVFAVSAGYNVEVYNIKGLKLYDSYCLDEEVGILKWSQSGKQLIAACDNKLRFITPKNREVTKASGTAFHMGEITVMHVASEIVYTGCIDGYVYATSLTSGKILGGTSQLGGTINTIQLAENYLMVGPSEPKLYWFETNKLKKVFENDLKGSSSDVVKLFDKNMFAVGDIQGLVSIFDRRSPMQPKLVLKAGNSVHQLFHDKKVLYAACEDGCVRGWDLSQLLEI